MAAKVQAQRQNCLAEAKPLAGSDVPIKERSVFYRGVERTKHSEAPVKISQRFVQSLEKNFLTAPAGAEEKEAFL